MTDKVQVVMALVDEFHRIPNRDNYNAIESYLRVVAPPVPEPSDKARFERRMLDFGWRNFEGRMDGEPRCWYYDNNDLNARWIGWREACAAPTEAATPQPASEPVAWMMCSPDKVTRLTMNRPTDQHRSLFSCIYPLYATPQPAAQPRPQPLTEQVEFTIAEGYRLHGYAQGTKECIAFHRGIEFAEAHHGITAQEPTE